MSILKKILSKIELHTLNEILFPSHCTLCKADGKYLCSNCELGLKKLDKEVNPWTHARYSYKDQQVKKLLYRIKYHHNPELGRLAGTYAQKSFKNFLNQDKIKTDTNNTYTDYVLVPIPLSKNRMNERRYNQAYEIALGLDIEYQKEKSETSHVKNILIRRKDTHKLHASHTIDQRVLELENAFDIDYTILETLKNTENRKVENKNENEIDSNYKNVKFILIDDITTSGTTLYEARRTLTNAGIKNENVFAFVLAH